ncbi:hypothetical protein [Rhodococcus xishaensis]|uniref:hypothetical protein n=1 Tax=Rhodococcus xishaensis TaxID=2487364 RepID=UPI0013E3504B|nr:hypothetical protein [Rhodococcus xishaensis]
MAANISRLEPIVDRLCEAQRVDTVEHGGHPSFWVRGKNFVLAADTSTGGRP